MTWCSKLHLAPLGFIALTIGLWAPSSLAQTSPTSTFDAKTVDIFDTTEGQSFNPLDIIHQSNLSREDPFSFFQRQQNNLNSEVSDFRSRQLEKLRDQGYQPPSINTPGNTTPALEETDPSLNPTESEPILRIDLPTNSSLGAPQFPLPSP